MVEAERQRPVPVNARYLVVAGLLILPLPGPSRALTACLSKATCWVPSLRTAGIVITSAT
ncbi:hypothetical protein [Parasutterella sp.]|uniref:hypothetical protein n=1 Tax=Parasutterella sp. TaxID=2049037 RepID=UPI003994DD94